MYEDVNLKFWLCSVFTVGKGQGNSSSLKASFPSPSGPQTQIYNPRMHCGP